MCAAVHYRPGVEVVPGYELVSMIGRGGFGEVWKAKGPGGVALAIKIIDKVDDKAGRKEFRSLKLIKDINHPNLVTIAGYWLKDIHGNLLDPDKITDESVPATVRPSELVIAMDLGEATLQEYLSECRRDLSPEQKGGIPVEELLDHLESAARAIDFLNQKHDVQHRDIKPQNILIVGGGAKICDFGLASTVSAVRTSMGGAGSLAYMAPEVYASKRPSRATDQYSLAIAYCELRTGRLPLADESYSALDDAKRKGLLDLSWLDEAERTVIAKATSLDPEERYPRCVDMIRALRRACAVGGDSTAEPESGRTLGDFVLRKRIFHRTGEEIWEATNPEGQRVALVVREVSESSDAADSATIALAREISRKHPHLAEPYDLVRLSEQGKALPPRLFDGPNPPSFARLALAGRIAPRHLGETIKAGGTDAQTLIPFFEQLAQAVDFLNQPQHDLRGRKVGIVHGNLRPVNFLVDGLQVRVGNFTSAQQLTGDVVDFPPGPRVTDDVYRPPEFADRKLTRWSDQFMLAVAYLQLRSGRPASGLSSSTLSGEGPESARRLDLSDLEPAEQPIIAKATARIPAQRYANCAELVAALRAAVPQRDDGPAALPPAPHMSTSSSSATAISAPKATTGIGRGSDFPTLVEPPAPSGRSSESTPPLLPQTPAASAPAASAPAASMPAASVPAASTQALPPNVQGTMMAPSFAETRISSDTDHAAADKATAEKVAGQTLLPRDDQPAPPAVSTAVAPLVSPPLPHTLKPPKKQASKPIAALPGLRSQPAQGANWPPRVAMALAALSLLVVAGWKFWPRGEQQVAVVPPSPSPSEVDPKLKTDTAPTPTPSKPGPPKPGPPKPGPPKPGPPKPGPQPDPVKPAVDPVAQDLQTVAATLSQAQTQLQGKEYAAAKQSLALLEPSTPLGKVIAAHVDSAPLRRYQEYASQASLLVEPVGEAEARTALAQVEARLRDAPPPDDAWLRQIADALHRLAQRKPPVAAGVVEAIPRTLEQLARSTQTPKVQSEIAALGQSLRAGEHESRLQALRALRDKATTPADFTQLLAAAEPLAKSAAPPPLALACQGEALLELNRAGSDREACRRRLFNLGIDGTDGSYVAYVRTVLPGSIDLRATWQNLSAVWPEFAHDVKSEKPAPPAKPEIKGAPWTAAARRCARAAMTLVDAGESLKNRPDDDPKLVDDRFSATSAAQAWPLYAMASSLHKLAGNHVVPGLLSEQQQRLGDLPLHVALTAAYAQRSDAVALTDALVADPKTAPSSHLYLANIALHGRAYETTKSPADRDRMLLAYGKLLKLCQQKTWVGTADAVFQRVVAPAYELLALPAAKADKSPAKVVDVAAASRPAAAAVCAARGRMLRVFPAIRKEIAAGGQRNPLVESKLSFDRAVQLEPTNPAHYVGRALATFEIADGDGSDHSQEILADAKQINALAGAKGEFASLAIGLAGMASFLEAANAPTLEVRLQKLADAERRLGKATDGLKSSAQVSQHQDELQRLLLTHGGMFLKLANYEPDYAKKEEWLKQGEQHAANIVRDYPSRRQPDLAYQLWGNTIEDFTLFKVKDDGYQRCLEKFEEQIRQAESADDPLGQARGRINLARAKIRLAGQKLGQAELQSIPARDDTPEKTKAKRESLDKVKAEVRANLASLRTDLQRAAGDADGFPGTQAAAYAQLARLEQLSVFGDHEAADRHFVQAIKLNAASDRNWPENVIDRANGRLLAAVQFLKPRQEERDKLAQWLAPIEQQVRELDQNADAGIREEFRVAAKSILFQINLWNEKPTAAEALVKLAKSDAIPGISPGGQFDLCIQMSDRLFALAKANIDADRLVLRGNERQWAIELLQHAHKLAPSASLARKSELYLANAEAYLHWRRRFTPRYNNRAASSVDQSTAKQLLIPLQAHAKIGASLADDQPWVEFATHRGSSILRQSAKDFGLWKTFVEDGKKYAADLP